MCYYQNSFSGYHCGKATGIISPHLFHFDLLCVLSSVISQHLGYWVYTNGFFFKKRKEKEKLPIFKACQKIQCITLYLLLGRNRRNDYKGRFGDFSESNVGAKLESTSQSTYTGSAKLYEFI